MRLYYPFILRAYSSNDSKHDKVKFPITGNMKQKKLAYYVHVCVCMNLQVVTTGQTHLWLEQLHICS